MNHPLSAIMGLCVGDALGVPVEFNSRESLKKKPVVDMRGFGSFNQPPGTWSDDTSMTLCLVDSLASGLDYDDVMARYSRWYEKGEYTPRGKTFDVGVSTRKAMIQYARGTKPLECGGTNERENGNGSLMRIIPILFHLRREFGTEFYQKEEAFDIIHKLSSLTHAHPRSQMACGLYVCVASMLMETAGKREAVAEGLSLAAEYYGKWEGWKDELNHYSRIFQEEFQSLEEESIQSSGYVVDTLEAALWCFLNTKTYKACVLKAVNLGEDTDTVGAVAGGLAGLYYGMENIPSGWLDKILRREYIEELVRKTFD